MCSQRKGGVGIKLHRQRPLPDPASFLTSSPVSISAAKERGAPAEWLLRSRAGGNRRRRWRRRGRRKPCCTCFPRQWAEQSSIGFSPSSPAPQPTDVWVGVRPGRESDTFSANPSFPFPMEPRFGRTIGNGQAVGRGENRVSIFRGLPPPLPPTGHSDYTAIRPVGRR